MGELMELSQVIQHRLHVAMCAGDEFNPRFAEISRDLWWVSADPSPRDGASGTIHRTATHADSLSLPAQNALKAVRDTASIRCWLLIQLSAGQ